MLTSNLFRDLDTFAGGFPLLARGLVNGFDSWGVPMNHWRDDTAVHYEFEVPGVKPEDISVEIDNGVLSVTVDKKLDDVSGDRLATERSYGRVVRRLSIDNSLDVENIGSELRDGVLTLEFPIREAAKPRKIEINVRDFAPQIESQKEDEDHATDSNVSDEESISA